MPYIKKSIREFLDNCQNPGNAGELNYLFTRLTHKYLKNNESYQAYNDIIGALEGCKLELYRKRTALYEDKKEKINGPI